MLEFTGERVIPGRVNDDLWCEHFARYAFARRYAEGRRVLDAGCGTGYGTAELGLSASQVVGLDVSGEAIDFARRSYSGTSLAFVPGTCTAMPFRSRCFDLVAGFEVIEHLQDYRAFVEECARVLTAEGLLIVSSPNRLYYTQSRGESGPNLFHEHEFEPEEFRSELSRLFPHVMLLAQNHAECFAFHPAKSFWPADTRLDSISGDLSAAQFLIAVCSMRAPVVERSFVYVPRAANLLREREQHITQLQHQLQELRDERDRLLELFRKQQLELEEHNAWAQRLNSELAQSAARVVELQNELHAVVAGYEEHVQQLDQNLERTVQWARSIEAQGEETQTQLANALQAKSRDLTECIALLDKAERTVVERTEWAQRVEAERNGLNAELNKVKVSRWVKLGRKIGLGPAIKA